MRCDDPLRLPSWVSRAGLLCTLVACNDSPVKLGEVPPVVSALPVVSLIQVKESLNDQFTASGAMSLGRCDILLVSGEWGTLARIRGDGTVDQRTSRLPGAPMSTRLSRGREGEAIAWSDEPRFGARVRPDLSLESLSLPTDAWGGNNAGPIIGLGEGYLFAPFGGSSPRQSPKPWRDAALALVLSAEGNEINAIGSVHDRGGSYLSWHSGRTMVGNRGDTVVLLNLSDGIVSGWLPPFSTPIWSAQLPRYLSAPAPREELWQYPWIHYGAELINLLALSQVSMATIGEDGTIYAIRNYTAEWDRMDERRLKTQGRWRIADKALEVYTHRGSLVERYALPSADIRWLSVGAHGRLFLRIADEVVVADFSGPPTRCPVLPARITIDVTDPAPDPAELVTVASVVPNS